MDESDDKSIVKSEGEDENDDIEFEGVKPARTSNTDGNISCALSSSRVKGD